MRTLCCVVAAVLGAGVVATACSPARPPRESLVHSETWCPDGFEAGPQDTCFAIPDRHTADTPILVYLHGMFTGHGSSSEWAFVRGAVQRGFAVVIPRGKRGMCAWTAELKDHFCWPQEAEDPVAFKTVVAEWDRVLWQVEALLETGTHKRYVLGYSNGGFFASYLAARGLFPAQAYAIVNGGGLARPRAGLASVPMMLVVAQDDAVQGPTMKAFHDELTSAGWAHAYCARSGSPPLADGDVDAALRFFQRDREGALMGPTYACEGSTRPAAGPSQSAPAPADPPEGRGPRRGPGDPPEGRAPKREAGDPAKK